MYIIILQPNYPSHQELSQSLGNMGIIQNLDATLQEGIYLIFRLRFTLFRDQRVFMKYRCVLQ